MAYTELHTEAQRIVNSPYPTTLQPLREILCEHTSQADIRRWTLSNPCQVSPLVAALLQGLKHWPYVLDIITSLALNETLRNDFLQQEPGLLDRLVSESIRSSDLAAQYALPAIEMLSRPLPDGVACPAGAQTLFIRLFDNAAAHPSAATVRPVYKMLKGMGVVLVNLLSNQAMSQFEEHVFKILQNHIKGPQEDCLSIYCLAIMKLLTTSPELMLRSSSERYDTQDFFASASCSTPRWRSDRMEQYFQGSKGQRTMQLVVLRALFACRPNGEAKIDDSCESLLLANEVIDAIPTDVKKAWTAANGVVTGKLLEKILAPEIDSRVQLHGLAFAASVYGPLNLSLRAKDMLSQKVMHVQALRHCEVQYGRLPLLDHATEIVDWRSVTRFVSEIVDFVLESDLSGSIELTAHLVLALDQLSTMTVHVPAVAEGVSAMLARQDCSSRLAKLVGLLRSTTPNDTLVHSDACNIALNNIRSSITKSLATLLLNAAYASEESRPPASTVQRLLDLHALACQSQRPCTHHLPPKQLSTSFGVDESLSTNDESIGWRHALDAHLQQKARDEHSSIAKIFANACADLEKRCERIEEPVRQERERYDGLQRQYDELNSAYSELETKGLEEGLRYEALAKEKEVCEGDLEASLEETQHLTQRISELEERLRSQVAEAESRIRDVRRAREDDALQHAMALASKEGQLEEMAELQRDMQRDVDAGREALQQAHDDFNDSEAEMQTLRQEIETSQRARAQQQDEIAALSEVELALTEQQSHMTGQIEKLQSDLAAAKDGEKDELARIRQETADAAEAVQVSHEIALAGLVTEREQESNGLRDVIARVEEEASQAQHKFKSELAHRGTKLQDYYKKIEKLQQKLHRKDEQIAEATAMRTNLMAAMGINALPSAPAAALSHRSRNPIAQASSTSDSQFDISPPNPNDTDETEIPSNSPDNVSFASLGETRNGPTPKRLRPARKSLRGSTAAAGAAAATTQTRAMRQSTLSRSVVKNSRQPLHGLSVNLSPSKGSRRSPMKGGDVEKTPNGTFGIDDSTFDGEGSEMFTGTQLDGGMIDLGRVFEEGG